MTPKPQSNRGPHRKDPETGFVGEVFPFFPLCIDEGSFSECPNTSVESAPCTVN